MSNYEIQTNKTTFNIWALDKRDARKSAAQIVQKMGQMFGEKIVKIVRIS